MSGMHRGWQYRCSGANRGIGPSGGSWGCRGIGGCQGCIGAGRECRGQGPVGV